MVAQTETNFALGSNSNSLWVAGIGEGFVRGAQALDVSAGGGVGMEVLGGRKEHDWGIGAVQYSRVLSDVRWRDHWYRGNWEVVGQLFAGHQVNPSGAYFVGVTPLLRYDWTAGHRLVPFVDGGAGLTLTDIRDGDLSSTFEFNVQGGMGVHWFLTDTVAVTLQYRYIHFSDLGMTRPNLGVNNNTVLLGVTAFF